MDEIWILDQAFVKENMLYADLNIVFFMKKNFELFAFVKRDYLDVLLERFQIEPVTKSGNCVSAKILSSEWIIQKFFLDYQGLIDGYYAGRYLLQTIRSHFDSLLKAHCSTTTFLSWIQLSIEKEIARTSKK